MEYYIDLKLSDAPWRKAESVTTQYSPEGRMWYTDQSPRPANCQWDNIHGDVICGPSMQNLKSGHTYMLRAILDLRDSSGGLHTYSNLVSARVADYVELCVEEVIAEKSKPVLHRHPDDLQPERLVNVNNLQWPARTVVNIRGWQYPDGEITKYSDFHWRYSYKWDTWGYGLGSAY